MLRQKIEKKFEPEPVKVMIPQESISYVKTSTHIILMLPYLSGTETKVILYLTSRVHKELGYAYPSVRTASCDLNISQNSFNNSVKQLEALDLIAVHRRKEGNRYYLRVPIEPNEDVLNDIIPEKVKKYQDKKEKAERDKNQYQLQFNKVIPFNPSCDSSVTEKEKSVSKNDSPAPKNGSGVAKSEVKEHQNLEHKQIQETEFNKTSYIETKEKDGDVILNNVKILKEYKITNSMATKLAKTINPDIKDLNSYIRFIVKNQTRDIRNLPGLLVTAIPNLQNDYLEMINKQKEEQEAKKAEQESQKEHEEVENEVRKQAEQIWNDMSPEEQEQVKEKVKKEYRLHQFNFSYEKTLKIYYVDYIKNNYL